VGVGYKEERSMDCKMAQAMIDSGQENEELLAHLRGCERCREERNLWGLLGEAKGLEPGLEFTERVLAKIKEEERRTPWDYFKAFLSRGFTSTRTLDEFSDFPPGSFGEVMFGDQRRAG
jgi:hypothetical protein